MINFSPTGSGSKQLDKYVGEFRNGAVSQEQSLCSGKLSLIFFSFGLSLTVEESIFLPMAIVTRETFEMANAKARESCFSTTAALDKALGVTTDPWARFEDIVNVAPCLESSFTLG